MRFTGLASCLVIVAGVASAHPGHDISQEIVERREFLSTVKRNDLSHCAEKLKARGVLERNVARRSAQVEKERAKRGLKKRDLDGVLNTSHNKTELGYTAVTDPAVLFEGYNSCLLTPEVTQGPYYVGGEYIRRNIIEEQEGVDIVLDYQVIDVDTCEPIPDVYLEIWHCNATGVYSGVVADGNGDSSDETNIDNTALRGIQKTNEDGVAQFESIFPGHYTGRATHIHVMVHTNATRYCNGTLGNEVSASHVGQAFFDQALISEVELQAPYNTNQQEFTQHRDFLDPKRDKYRAAFDIRQSFSANALYPLPFGRGQAIGRDVNPIIDKLIGGWQIQGLVRVNTGSPFSIASNRATTPSSLGETAMIRNMTPQELQKQIGVYKIEDRVFWLNPDSGLVIINRNAAGAITSTTPVLCTAGQTTPCFAHPLAGEYGNTNFFDFTAPGFWNQDLSVIKRTSVPSISERFNVEIRIEAFNAFNHPNFFAPGEGTLGVPGTSGLTSTNFGQLTSIVDTVRGGGVTSRIIQWGVRVNW